MRLLPYEIVWCGCLDILLDVKTTAEMVVMLVMLVLCSGNIYHGQHMWVVRLPKRMADFE